MAQRESGQERLKRMTRIDLELLDQGYLLVGGVDEAGRGPLAGPVVAACAVMPLEEGALLAGVNDSKKLSPGAREALYPQIAQRALCLGIGLASVEEIEALNIKNASRLAMERAVAQTRADVLLVDAERDLAVGRPQRALIHGDALSYSIACASIAAKVTRDRLMEELDRQYPGYGFAKHKGYGTAEHMEAIRRLGPCPIHRRLFLRKLWGEGRP